MKIYYYDEITKEYLYESEADLDPLESQLRGIEVYMIPAYSTQIPPVLKAGKCSVFESDNWVLKPDNRGKEVINLETLQFETVDYIGNIKEGYQVISEEMKEDFLANPECYVVRDDKLVSIKGTKELADKFEDKFNQEFIETNLGCVRINTKWGNFLAIKPNYDVQVQTLGSLPAGVLVLYHRPNFIQFNNYSEVENWLLTEGQYKNEIVTSEDYAIFSQQIISRFVSEV